MAASVGVSRAVVDGWERGGTGGGEVIAVALAAVAVREIKTAFRY